jgi:hypothetical protein
VVLLIPDVELEHQLAIDEEPILQVVVIRCHHFARARGAEQCRVPAGARAHVANRQQGSRTDRLGHWGSLPRTRMPSTHGGLERARRAFTQWSRRSLHETAGKRGLTSAVMTQRATP